MWENHAREMDLTRAGEKAASDRFAIEEARFGKLMEILFQQGKQELVLQAYHDKELRKKLYKEYEIQ